MANPNERTLQALRKKGRLAGVVERWNSYVKIRQDLWGMLDIVEVGEDGRFHGHQPTSDSNVSAHILKLRKAKHYEQFLRDGARLFVWGWGKKGARGERKLWTCRVIEMNLTDYPPIKEALPEDAGRTVPGALRGDELDQENQGDDPPGQVHAGLPGIPELKGSTPYCE
jgi:hypothetical protein